ncbi:MAG TPA: extracellular solute-binding protein [Solirubrobacteraceae bacterium]|nr:extracellular solute-binding protein [Solirubrobacteraceae bacterium]
MNKLKPSVAVLASVTATLLLAACGGGSSGSSKQASSPDAPIRGQSITLYSGQHEQTTAMLVAAFERHSGVKVKTRPGDEAELADQILQEGSSSPADVFYTENTPPLERLRAQGLLAPVDSATLAAVPARYDSGQGYWVGVSGRISSLVYNTSQIAPSDLPTSILALAEPKWKGKLGIAPSETDFQPLITSITKFYGAAAAERWLQGIKRNSKTYPDNETVVTQVNNGESAVGLINHYYWFRLRDEVGSKGLHSALAYYAPHDAGDLLDVSGAAVLKSSTHQAAAQAFLAFLVSVEGQQVLAHSHSYEYPLRPGVAPAKGLRPFAQLQPASISLAQLGDGAAPLELEQKLGLL